MTEPTGFEITVSRRDQLIFTYRAGLLARGKAKMTLRRGAYKAGVRISIEPIGGSFWQREYGVVVTGPSTNIKIFAGALQQWIEEDQMSKTEPTTKDGWFPYPGHYEKVFFDIRLKDGRTICNCWPNAGVFHSMAGDGVYVDEQYVTHYRYHKDEEA